LESHPQGREDPAAGRRPAFQPRPPERAALRRRWANLIRRVYEVDPLVCPRCGAEMRVIGFITEPSVIKRILDHIRKRDKICRPPPPRAVASIASNPTPPGPARPSEGRVVGQGRIGLRVDSARACTTGQAGSCRPRTATKGSHPVQKRCCPSLTLTSILKRLPTRPRRAAARARRRQG